jgi:hypothetical protein
VVGLMPGMSKNTSKAKCDWEHSTAEALTLFMK